MDMTKIFPSQWFSASDFDAVGTEMTIGNVMMQQVGAEFKPVVYFNGQEKGMVLNPTNNKLMCSMPHLGGESKEWTGKKVILFSFTAMFNGQPQQRLGVRAPDGRATVAAPSPVPNRSLKDEMNDEVPF
jgi:hypothetical protein